MSMFKLSNLISNSRTQNKTGRERQLHLIIISSKKHQKKLLQKSKRKNLVQFQKDEEKNRSQESSFENSLQKLNKYRALVVDNAYQPVEIIDWQRAICMDIVGKVDVLEYYDITVNSSRDEFFLPAVIRVHIYIQKIRRVGHIPVSRSSILSRDKNTCQYCGSNTNLSIDHLIPVSKGGEWSWDNLVTACQKCNNKKGDKTLEQLGWKLKKFPKTPTFYETTLLGGKSLAKPVTTPQQWQDYLSPFMEVVVDITDATDAPEQFA